jgi:hypothetical protein
MTCRVSVPTPEVTNHHTEASMTRSALLAVAVFIAALLTTGCVSTTELVRALGQDPSSVCVSVTTIYGKGAACRVGSAVEVKAGDGAISVTSK